MHILSVAILRSRFAAGRVASAIVVVSAVLASFAVAPAAAGADGPAVLVAPTVTDTDVVGHPSLVGETVQFDVTVTSGGNPVSTGSVTFTTDGVPMGIMPVDATGHDVWPSFGADVRARRTAM